MFKHLIMLGLDINDQNLILSNLSAPERYYHTVMHVLDVIDGSEDPMIWALAWFHDVIYDVHRNDNERRSAQLGIKMLEKNNPLKIDLDVFFEACVDTANHNARSDVSKAFSDRDMAILASLSGRYGIYRRQIRMEWAHVPWEQYSTGRAEVLKKFNERTIFYTPEYMVREELAHDNMRKEIWLLEHKTEAEFMG